MALKIDFRSVGFGFGSVLAADFAAGFPAAFFDAAWDFDPWALASFVVCLLVTASSVFVKGSAFEKRQRRMALVRTPDGSI
ncbi:MAG: hypothetical protein JNK07_12205 [Alphaproteobacteria bacterium]|nr:hypothetical protein [Alphaproteobacteria bacterium]